MWILQSLMWLLFFSTLLFFNSSSPVALVILVILTSFNMCVLLKIILFTSWFSYILFLIFLGGLMVLFIYICSIASNEQINFSSLSSSALMSILITPFLACYLFKLNDVKTLNVSLEAMYSFFNSSLILISVSYLLLTLFVSVQISKMKFGPMRSKKS